MNDSEAKLFTAIRSLDPSARKHILEYMKDNIPNYHRLEINPHPDQYTEFIDNILIFEYLYSQFNEEYTKETFPEVIKKYIPYE